MNRASTKTKVSFDPMSTPSREGSLRHIEDCKERWQRSSRSTSSPQGHRLHGRVAASACLEYQPNRTAKCSSVPSTTRARRPYSGSGSWAPSRCITYQAATGCSPERSTGTKVVFSSMLSPSRVGTVNSAATRARGGLCHPHSTSVRDSPRSRLRSRAVDRSSVAQLRTTHS